jgi:hypothetical protein
MTKDRGYILSYDFKISAVANSLFLIQGIVADGLVRIKNTAEYQQ